jgi:hypothetical protein
VKLNLACNRFKKLWNEQDERPLTRKETRFLEKHRQSCPECRSFESSGEFALTMLRDAAMEISVSRGFDERVLRKVRVQTGRQSLTYWSPAFIGGAIACAALIAALQIASAPAQVKRATLPEGEARIGVGSDQPLPKLILESKPHLNQ